MQNSGHYLNSGRNRFPPHLHQIVMNSLKTKTESERERGGEKGGVMRGASYTQVSGEGGDKALLS
jgi:hypothetical protein